MMDPGSYLPVTGGENTITLDFVSNGLKEWSVFDF